MKAISQILPFLLLVLPACSDVEKADHDHDHEHEIITTVILTFTSLTDDSELEFIWSDADNNGSPLIDDIVLQDASDYTLGIEFLNELEDPAEDITPEIVDEGDEHQLFFTGSAVEGPATGTNADAIIEQAYADEDDNQLPLGLANTITTLATGSGELSVALRHFPMEDGNPVKLEDMAEDVANAGFGAIPGENDVQVSFNLAVE